MNERFKLFLRKKRVRYLVTGLLTIIFISLLGITVYATIVRPSQNNKKTQPLVPFPSSLPISFPENETYTIVIKDSIDNCGQRGYTNPYHKEFFFTINSCEVELLSKTYINGDYGDFLFTDITISSQYEPDVQFMIELRVPYGYSGYHNTFSQCFDGTFYPISYSTFVRVSYPGMPFRHHPKSISNYKFIGEINGLSYRGYEKLRQQMPVSSGSLNECLNLGTSVLSFPASYRYAQIGQNGNYYPISPLSYARTFVTFYNSDLDNKSQYIPVFDAIIDSISYPVTF